MNYSELLQLAKGWGNFVSERINIGHLPGVYQSLCKPSNQCKGQGWNGCQLYHAGYDVHHPGRYLDQEMDEELGYSKYDYRNKETDNSRNGHSQKIMHTSYGDMESDIPRDRKGEFEPQIVKKNQNTVTQDMEEKIISMYAKGMTTNDIESHMRELYDIEISDSTISRITDKILSIVKEWQERPLEEIYAVVFMDAIHYHVRNEGRIVSGKYPDRMCRRPNRLSSGN